MAKPKDLIYIEVVPGGAKLEYRQPGGGVFNNLSTAQQRIDSLVRSGVHFRLWRTQCNWEEIDDQGS